MTVKSSFSIDRISKPDYQDFVDQYLTTNTPVVIEDAIGHWPAMQKWAPDYFLTHFAKKPVSVNNRQRTLGEFITTANNPTKDTQSEYLKGIFIRSEFPEIAQDIEPDLTYTLPDRLRSKWMFDCRHKSENGIPELLIAGKGGQFHLHYDVDHMLGFVTQIHGSKEFILFAPDQTKYLYPRDDLIHTSQIPDVFNPNLDKYPLLSQAAATRFTLNPGEVLFNPPGWWHTTQIIDFSIAMVISTVSHVNWNAFCNDTLLDSSSKKWKTPLKKLYIKIANQLMNQEEKLNIPAR